MREGQRKTKKWKGWRNRGKDNNRVTERLEKQRAGGREHIERHRHRQRENERRVLAEQTIYLSLLLPSAFLTQTQTIGYNCPCVFIRR